MITPSPSITGAKPTEARTIVIAMSIPAETLAWLRGEFADVRFVAPAAEGGDGAPFQVAYREPSAVELEDADAVIGWELSPQALAAAHRLHWIHAASAGVEHFDLAAIAARGIVMTNSRGVHAPNIAEHVLGMMLALSRRLPRLVQAQAAREWRDTATHGEVSELLGQTVLVVGLGEIGREVAARASGFGMRVRAVRRTGSGDSPGVVERVYPVAALAEALADADHVVVTLPDTRESRGLFGATAFAAMKPGPTL
jgi:D-2-hydroxyacid dehydrogenase (NADP+)